MKVINNCIVPRVIKRFISPAVIATIPRFSNYCNEQIEVQKVENRGIEVITEAKYKALYCRGTIIIFTSTGQNFETGSKVALMQIVKLKTILIS
jgi:hypothetical protein